MHTVGVAGHIRRISTQVSTPSSSHVPPSGLRQTEVAEERGSSLSRARDVGQGGYRTGVGSVHARVLQPSLSGAQTVRRVPAGHRPVVPQRPLGHSDFSDGDSRADPPLSAPGLLGNFTRSEGRVFSHTDPSVLSKIPSVSDRGQLLSVPGSSFWYRHGSLAVHQGSLGGQKDCAHLGDRVVPVPGRLVNPSGVRGIVPSTHPVGTDIVFRAGSDCEPSKVGASTGSEIHFSGLRFRLGSLSMLPPTVEIRQDLESGTIYRTPQGYRGAPVAGSFRPPGVHREDGSLGAHEHTRGAFCLEIPMGLRQAPRPSLRKTTSVSTQQSLLVDAASQCTSRCTDRASGPDRPYSYGRVFAGMGSTLGVRHSLRTVDPRRGYQPYQLLRVESRCPRREVLATQTSSPVSTYRTRQYHGSGIYQQPRRYPLSVPHKANSFVVTPLPGFRHPVASETHSRKQECVSRRLVTEGSVVARRVVCESISLRRDHSSVGLPHHGSIRHETQCKTSSLCVAGRGPFGHGGGRHVHELERHVGIRVSSTCTSSSSLAQDPPGSVRDYPDRSPLARGQMVCAPASTVGSSATPLAPGQRSSGAERSSPQGPFELVTSRVSAIRKALRDKGFSRQVADRAARPQRSSTLAIYESKWRKFVDWCGQRKINPFSASEASVGDFLLDLFNSKKLAVSTLEGYRMAIAGTLRVTCGVEVGRSDTLKALIQNIRGESARLRCPAPDWDLALVLRRLRHHPFEPIQSISLQLLTWKTVFLVALASGKRRGEIHALLFSSFSRNLHWSSINLSVSPSFLAKTALTERGPKTLLSVTIPSLDDFVGSDMPDELLLCPVRAVRMYLDRTKDLRVGKRLFFISPVLSLRRDISAVSISRWIVKTIQLCYKVEGERLVSPVKAHSVRALATSLAFFRQASLEQIIRAGTWTSANTFISFYLTDLSSLCGDLSRVGPLVSAGVVLPATARQA